MTTNAPASKQRSAISGPLSWSSIGTKRGELDGAKFSGKPTARICQISPFSEAPE